MLSPSRQSHCGENQDRLNIPGDWNEMGFKGPSNLNHSMIPTQAALWGSPARPELLQERPEVPLCLVPMVSPCALQDGCSCKTSRLLSQLKENPDLLQCYLKHLQKCRASFVEVFQVRLDGVGNNLA